ncbi:hypothetical protein EXU57_09120 [Segetibacter sp. 3557_3]|uniref:multiheme c-type cytochrome n=1 Tax=Segetibacter sp. 3557_3 TaxID=2547429 RepID=UPI001058B4FC|nr:multiheme c-type cytochrome [Segetibacter sp. 3557_3]TDH26955.1 hypothetical protein EXU57_09120 [Segetibacter sp. 3557_3]
MKNKKAFILILVISSLVAFLSRCMRGTETGNDPRGKMYIGAESCKQCHKSVYDAYLTTAHFNSTQTTLPGKVLGSFTQPQNTYVVDSITNIRMEHRDSGLFQVLYVNGNQQELHRMDITFGPKHAQTFLYWQGDRAYELPISYYAEIQNWASSPAYPSVLNFNRLIGGGCFECHSSYIKSKLVMGKRGYEEALDKRSLINGIDCERCHGPAANHVNYHLAYPEVKAAKYMVTAGYLSRQQQLDACAVCHSGNDIRKEISTFHFKMGDTLANFFLPAASRTTNSATFDVHGNQYNLLAQSQCFLSSKVMTCATCHDPHTNAGTNSTEYVAKCMGCHTNPDHSALKNDAVSANNLQTNCINCHMPAQESRAITFQTAGSKLQSAYTLRTHRIAIYNGNSTAPGAKTIKHR